MFCPQCGYEYVEGIRNCPDCGAGLVASLPGEEKSGEEDRFVPLPNLPGRVYAEMIQGALEKRGIPSYIRSQGPGDAYQFSGTTPRSGVQLFVPESRFDECLEIQHQMLDHI